MADDSFREVLQEMAESDFSSRVLEDLARDDVFHPRVMVSCPHERIDADVSTTRVTDGNGNVVGFTADVQLACAGCGCPMEFLGMEHGLHPREPRAGLSGLEARLPIRPNPAAADIVCNPQVVDGRRLYRVPHEDPKERGRQGLPTTTDPEEG